LKVLIDETSEKGGLAMKMKRHTRNIVTLCTILLVQAWAGMAFAEEDSDIPPHLRTTIHDHREADIIEALILMGPFKTLVRALKAAELEETLRGEGPLTLFAPTDQAFDKLPGGKLEGLFQPQNRDKLRNILLNHIVSDKIMLADFGRCCRTMDGTLLPIHISVDKIHIDKSELIRADIMCANGVIHAVDAVIVQDE
jgi:uncharacterized surface protein with fasciclin (FAS1) repeats